LIRIVAVCAGLFSVAGYGNTLSWSGGGGANAYWNNSANWGFAGVPANGDTVIFSASQPNPLNTNNITGLVLNQIHFVGAGGGYDIRGNAFTLTNSIIATNTAGANIIENNITLATANVLMVVSNGVSLTLDGNLSGSVGVTKAGLGTLLYQCSGNNTYTSTTLVSGGTLQFNVSGANAISGPLVIGDGTGAGSPTVVDLQSEEMNTLPSVTINLNGTLNLNNFSEPYFSTSLTLSDGTIQTGTGILTLSPNATITVANYPTINGYMNIGSSGTCTIQGSGYIYLTAGISGSASIVKNGSVGLWLYASNTFTGTLTANSSGYLYLLNNNALGATNSGTILNGSTLVYIASGVNITNEPLTLNSASVPAIYTYANSTNTWVSTNFTVSANEYIFVGTNGALELNGPISGTGGVTKYAPGRLIYSGAIGNSYAGLTTVNEGELDLAKSGGYAIAPFGAGLMIGDGVGTDIVRNYGSQQIWGMAPMTITNSGVWDLNNYTDSADPLTLNGGQILTGAGLCAMINTVKIGSDSSVHGKVRLDTSNVVFSNTAPSILYMYASVFGYSSTYGLTKAGNGDLYLISSNSYGGLTVVQQGKLRAQNSSALGATSGGTVVSSGATLVLDGSIGITNEALTLNGPGVDSGWGALDVENGVNTWAGPITNNANSTLDAWSAGSELHINGPISGAGGLEVFGYSGGGGTHFFEGSAANTYAGLTTVDVGSTLALNNTSGSDSAIPHDLVIYGTVRNLLPAQINNSSSTVTIGTSGLLDLSGGGDGIRSLNGSGSVNLGANYVDSFGSGAHTYSGVISGSGEFDVAANNITYTLNGNNTYTGLTRLYDGFTSIVKINGSQPQSPVYVGSLATLGGSGTVGTIAASGTISPGNSPGILNCSNVTFSSTGNYTVELDGPNPGTGYDQLNVTGTNTLANATLSVIPSFTTPVSIGQQFIIITNDLVDAITGTFSGLAEGATFNVGGFDFKISYVGGTGNDVVLTLVGVPAAQASYAVASGDGNAVIDPNECDALRIGITNKTATPMTGISATLTSADPNVIVTQPLSTYPNVLASGRSTNATAFQISTLPSFACGNNINLNLTVNSTSHGPFTLPVVLKSGEASTSPSRYDNNASATIPDVGSVESTNMVGGFSGPVMKVVVSLYLTHTYDQDLTNISLIGPDGTTLMLSAANGGSGQNYGSGTSDASRTTFDDAAATSITSGTAPFVGTFRPQSPLSAFIGSTNVNGNWRLHMADGYGGSLGTLRAWSLFLYPVACGSGGGACALCADGTLYTNTLDASGAVMTNRLYRNSVASACGSSKPYPGPPYAGSFYYHAYPFYNASSNACITVMLTSFGGDLMGSAYLGAFNPADFSINYLADSGTSTAGAGAEAYSFNVPANSIFIVVINSVTTTGTYSLSVSGGDCTPVLNIAPAGSAKVDVNWPTVAGSYQLEAAPSLPASVWTAVTNEPVAFSNLFNVTNSSVSPTNQFYRLHKP
jgi:autotransporter-associated beta strand protein